MDRGDRERGEPGAASPQPKGEQADQRDDDRPEDGLRDESGAPSV